MRLAALSLFLLSCVVATAHATTPSAPRATLRPFADEREFDALIERWRAQAPQHLARQRAADLGGLMTQFAPAAAPAAAMADAAAKAESITNVQTAGVDEGGIVKRAGDHLVILRRGRLFTVRVADGGAPVLRPAAAIEAYAPGSDPQGAWYDELLIHGRTVVVIGYSYARGGTEIGLFELGDDGTLGYRATHHLKSHDYYSSRNYASRLVGTRLVFYTPMQLNAGSLRAGQFLPQWRRWNAATPENWQRILPATRIFRTDDDLDPFAGGAALHTVTACDLAQPQQMRCESSAVLGPPGRVFYVSADNVYVWTVQWRHPHAGTDAVARSAVLRLPLAGGAPSMLKTTGSPIDQLSFLQDEGGHLNVLLRAQARGDGMWHAESGAGDLALLRVPLASFGDSSDVAPRGAYRPLPAVAGLALHNRFVGDWLLYGGSGSPGAAGHAVALRFRDRGDAQTLALPHGVERIEAMGSDAVLVGSAGRDLHFSSLALAGEQARVGGSHVRRDAAQGESRSHGFFYRAQGRDGGVIGLPVLAGGQQRGPTSASAAVLFLRNRALTLQPAGELRAAAQSPRDDQCKASCVDWYGNARPIFLGDRVFALLGYELVEGRLGWRGWPGERIEELRRVDFAPQPALAWGRE